MAVREIEFEDFLKAMDFLASDFGKDFEPALREAYPVIQADIEDHFAASEGPHTTWPLHSPVTIGIHGPHPLLILTGALAAAATGTGTGHVVEFTTHELTYGVGGIPYAAVHQFGWGNIPQREYLWVSDAALDQIADIVADYAVKTILAALD